MRFVEAESWRDMGAALADMRQSKFEQRQRATRARMEELMRKCAEARKSAAQRKVEIARRGGLIPYAGAEKDKWHIAVPDGDIGYQAGGVCGTPIRPSQDLLEDRDRRLSAPYRDLTAMLLGDPRVGQSALDKKRARHA